MQARTLLITVLALATATATPTSITFSPPADFEGTVEGEYSWMLIVLGKRDDMHVDLDLGPGQLVNRTVLHTRLDSAAATLHRHESLDASPARSGPFAATLLAGDEWMSLFIVGRVNASVGPGEGVISLASDSMDLLVPEGVPREAYREALVPRSGPVTIMSGPLEFSIEGVVEGAEWHEARITCHAGDCPDGGRGVRHHSSAQRVEALSYVEAVATGGINGSGSAKTIVAGASPLDMALNGTLRLPRTSGIACDCRDGTLRLEGHVAFDGLRPSGDGLATGISGSFTGARLDEVDLQPGFIATPAATVLAAAGLGLAWALARYGPAMAALLVRDRGKPEHPNRARLLQMIQAHPGVSLNQLCRLASLSKSTVEHHLHILLRSGLVVRHRFGVRHAYFENHGKYGKQDRVLHAVLQDERLKRLMLLVSRLERPTQVEVVRRAQEEYLWPASTTQDRLGLLAARGLLESGMERGRRWYRAKSPG